MFDIIDRGLVLREVAKESSLEEVRLKTGAQYKVSNEVKRF